MRRSRLRIGLLALLVLLALAVCLGIAMGWPFGRRTGQVVFTAHAAGTNAVRYLSIFAFTVRTPCVDSVSATAMRTCRSAATRAPSIQTRGSDEASRFPTMRRWFVRTAPTKWSAFQASFAKPRTADTG